MEEWKDILGFERYQVSSLGRVRSKEFTRINKRFIKGHYQEFACYYPSKLLKPDISVFSNSSYQRVTLSKDNKTYRFLVHRLVAEAFIPNPENKPYVNHIDNNGLHNSIDNLEWVTHSENMLWAQKQGRLFTSQSNAGKEAGRLARLKAEAKITALCGKRVNDWTVLDKFKKTGKNYKVLCQCKCGRQAFIDLYRLNLSNKNAVTCCNSCSKQKIKI